MRAIISCALFFLFTCWVQGQDGARHSGWGNKMEREMRVFIENKGQFDKGYNDGQGDILFGTMETGINMSWSKKGLTYEVTEKYLTAEAKREMAREAKEGHTVEEWEHMRTRYHYLHMEWVDANPDPKVVAENVVPYYFTYADREDKTGTKGLKAQAYKKITYLDIYPGIDAEYVLPDKGGVKYSFIVHPGADISKIKMRYKGANNVALANGGIEIKTAECGDLLESGLKTYYENGNVVASAFTMQKEVFGFNVPYYDKSKTLIIDPWVSVVSMPNNYPANASAIIRAKTGYDVCFDYAGNAWVLGGEIYTGLRVAKYSSAGALLWMYAVPLAPSGPWGADDLVGDIEVNKQSGTLYVCQGANVWQANVTGAAIYKVSPTGALQTTFPGDKYCAEISRLRLTCAGKLYGTGGGITLAGQGKYQIFSIDTTFAGGMTGEHVTTSQNGDHDANLMCLDPSGNYLYHNYNYPAPGSPDFLHNNEMYKEPIPALTPPVWMNPGPIYAFVELNSIRYAQPPPYSTNTGRINMFNGMVCGNGFLYTYNGDTLKKWNKNTGAYIGEVKTGGKRYWSGGLDIDLCEYVYAGVGNAVKVYDGSLSLVNTIPLPDTSCYDLKIDRKNNRLFATGVGYVCSINLTPPVLQLTATVTPTGCGGCTGTASANISCNTAAFEYLWLPGGQTTASITGQCAGTYTVIATTDVTCAQTIGDTAIVTIPPAGGVPPTANVNSTSASCAGSNGTASASVSGGTGPYSYSWSPSGGTNASATGLSAGTYTVVVTDALGCTTSNTISVTQTGALAVISNNSTICAGQSSTLTASGGTTYSWNTGATTTSIVVNPTVTTTYTVTVTDTTNGCTGMAMPVVNITSPPVAQAPNITVCSGQNSTLSASGGGTYAWNTGDTDASITISPTANTSYTVVVSFGSCSDTTTAMVNVAPSPTVALSPDQTLCKGQSATLDAGNSGAAYLWSTGETTQNISVTGAGTYWVFVALNNCGAKDTVQTFIAPEVQLSDSNLCTTSPIVLDPGAGATSYLWSNGSTTQTISVDGAGQFWVVALFGNCLSSDSSTITGDGTGGTLYIPNAFTPNEDNINEIFLAKGTGISAFEMHIFDRWGNLLFYSDDVNKGWDGKIEGGHYTFKKDGESVAQEDVYVWTIDYSTQCFPDQMKKELGIVSIVK